MVQCIEPSPHEAILRIAGEMDASMIMVNWPGDVPGEDGVVGDELELLIWNAEVPVFVSRMTMAAKA